MKAAHKDGSCREAILLIGPGGIGKTGYFHSMPLSKKVKALALYAMTKKHVFFISWGDGASEICT